MFGLNKRGEHAAEALSIRRWQAVIEFDLKGNVLTANPAFLATMGYEKAEIVGQHHSMFVPATERDTAEYRNFWDRLRNGEAGQAQYLRTAKGGRRVWLQATYTPICGKSGTQPYKIVKFATDITAQKDALSNAEGQIAAINRSQAVIEFDLEGRVLHANPHFLASLGYELAEVVGQHHAMFVEPAYRTSLEYKVFWSNLAAGRYDQGQYLRIGKNGRQVWIQATYNPILNGLGEPFKVVKYATDITAAKLAQNVLQAAVEETRALVEGATRKDLTQRIAMRDKTGDVAVLCSGINELIDTVREIIRTTRDISDQISTGADQIGADSRMLAQRTEEQASSLQETAATTEELAASVKHSATRANDASGLGSMALQAARSGGDVATAAVTAMERIEQASSGISAIITVIDGIAFQTNLLALNAAVEAARAGDAGKGFAVVAAEVRALAQRSSEAANDIKSLISNSTSEVTNGVRLVKEVGQALAQIVESSESVATALSDIASAAHEQANGVEEVAKVVAHMDDMTQRNSAMADQSADVASDLTSATATLKHLVESFKLDGAAARRVVAEQRLRRSA